MITWWWCTGAVVLCGRLCGRLGAGSDVLGVAAGSLPHLLDCGLVRMGLVFVWLIGATTASAFSVWATVGSCGAWPRG